MRLNILKSKIEVFRQYFAGDIILKNNWLYEKQTMFDKNWRSDHEHIKTSLKWLLSSNLTTRIWKKPGYEPKRMILAFAESDSAFISQCFNELFNEDLNIEHRMERFRFYMDVALQDFKSKNPLVVDNNHYQDASVISYYLAMRFPKRYAYYVPKDFEFLLGELGATFTRNVADPARFFKTSLIIYDYLMKDPMVREKQMHRLESIPMANSHSMLIVSEFVHFCKHKRSILGDSAL